MGLLFLQGQNNRSVEIQKHDASIPNSILIYRRLRSTPTQKKVLIIVRRYYRLISSRDVELISFSDLGAISKRLRDVTVLSPKIRRWYCMEHGDLKSEYESEGRRQVRVRKNLLLGPTLDSGCQ